MIAIKVLVLSVLALCAFAGNSILSRIVLRSGEIDPASFTLLRLLVAGITLSLISVLRKQPALSANPSKGCWKAAAIVCG